VNVSSLHTDGLRHEKCEKTNSIYIGFYLLLTAIELNQMSNWTELKRLQTLRRKWCLARVLPEKVCGFGFTFH